jgi:hypothetical protein
LSAALAGLKNHSRPEPDEEPVLVVVTRLDRKPAPVHSLEEIVRGGLFHSSLAEVLNARLASKGRDSREYQIALAKRAAIQQTILKVIEDQKLDALVYPTLRRKPARIIITSRKADPIASSAPLRDFPPSACRPALPRIAFRSESSYWAALLTTQSWCLMLMRTSRRHTTVALPLRTPAPNGESSVPLISWQSSVQEPGSDSTVSAKFTFDSATNELTYNITADFPEGEILGATIHRAAKGDTTSARPNGGRSFRASGSQPAG